MYWAGLQQGAKHSPYQALTFEVGLWSLGPLSFLSLWLSAAAWSVLQSGARLAGRMLRVRVENPSSSVNANVMVLLASVHRDPDCQNSAA